MYYKDERYPVKLLLHLNYHLDTIP